MEVRHVTISMYDTDTGLQLYKQHKDCQFTIDKPLPEFVYKCIQSFYRGILQGKRLSIHIDCEDVRTQINLYRNLF